MQVLQEALLPFLAGFPTSRLKLITMYIEQRRAADRRAADSAKLETVVALRTGGDGGGGGGTGVRISGGGGRVGRASPVTFTPIR